MKLPTEPVPRWIQGRDALGWAVLVAACVVAASLVYLIVLIPTGTSALPAQSVGDQRLQDLNALKSAAQYELTALYTLDYKTADATVANVAAGATGTFADDWQTRSVTYRTGLATLQTRATSKIGGLSVHQIKGDTATLIAAVNQDLTNTQTQGTKATTGCAAGHYCGVYHLWITYQRVGGQWKLSNLDYFNE